MNFIKGIIILFLFHGTFGFQQNGYFDYLEKKSSRIIQNRKRTLMDWNRKEGNFTSFNNTMVPNIIFIEQLALPKKEEVEKIDIIDEKPKMNFSNIGGYREIKNELIQMKELLVDIDKYKDYNIRVPKGLLLEGPPGNGKTLLAKCFAGECGFDFLSVSGAEFNEKYVGVGAARVRELFEKAKRKQPCVLFIDELDAIGGKRSTDTEGSSNERFQTLNQLLVSMDGYDSDTMKQIFIIAATNRKDILDEALLRSGRFDKIVHVPNPDSETREKIIEIHRVKKPISPLLNLEDIVELTKGMSGADIENILNEASLLALRRNTTVDSIKILEEIRDRILIGTTNQKRELSMVVKERVAIHECGHLLVSLMCPLHEKPTKVTIESSGHGTLGYTFFSISEDKVGLYSKQFLKERIMTLLAGRVAEEIFFNGEVSTGAVDDLYKVMDIAKKMVVEHGMVRKPIFSFISEYGKEIADKQIQLIIEEAYNDVYTLLERNKDLLYWYSKELLFQNTLQKYNIYRLIELGLKKYPSNDFKNI